MATSSRRSPSEEDLATMIASAVDNANAKDEIFNCVTQKGVTLRGMAEVCAKAMGKEATIVTYKEGSVEGVETKKQFPFRGHAHLQRHCGDGEIGLGTETPGFGGDFEGQIRGILRERQRYEGDDL